MNLAGVIQRMREAGAPPEAIVIAVEAIEEAKAGLDARRANDRARKARQLGKANDVPSSTSREPSREPSREDHVNPLKERSKPPNPRYLASLGIDDEGAQARARVGGSRLPTEWTPSAALVAFAGDLGIIGPELDEKAAEFGDYWRAVPGYRGRKLDWDATFKNRLREVASRKKGTAQNGQRSSGKGSIVEAGRRLSERLIAERREREMHAGTSGGDGDPTVRFLPGIGSQRS